MCMFIPVALMHRGIGLAALADKLCSQVLQSCGRYRGSLLIRHKPLKPSIYQRWGGAGSRLCESPSLSLNSSIFMHTHMHTQNQNHYLFNSVFLTAQSVCKGWAHTEWPPAWGELLCSWEILEQKFELQQVPGHFCSAPLLFLNNGDNCVMWRCIFFTQPAYQALSKELEMKPMRKRKLKNS